MVGLNTYSQCLLVSFPSQDYQKHSPGNKLDFCIFWDLPLEPQDPVLMELEGKKVAS